MPSAPAVVSVGSTARAALGLGHPLDRARCAWKRSSAASVISYPAPTLTATSCAAPHPPVRGLVVHTEPACRGLQVHSGPFPVGSRGVQRLTPCVTGELPFRVSLSAESPRLDATVLQPWRSPDESVVRYRPRTPTLAIGSTDERLAEAAAGGVVDLLIGVPAPTGEQAEKYQKYLASAARPREQRGLHVPGAVHVQGRAGVRRPRRSRSSNARRRDGRLRHQRRHAERRDEPRGAPGGGRAPRPLHRELGRRPEPGHGRDPRARAGGRAARREVGAGLPRGPDAAGPDQRQEDVSALREVHRARHPDLRQRRRARAAGADGVPGRRADRRGVLVLPRAEVRDPARLRTVDRRSR